jgi:acyl carrier protein
MAARGTGQDYQRRKFRGVSELQPEIGISILDQLIEQGVNGEVVVVPFDFTELSKNFVPGQEPHFLEDLMGEGSIVRDQRDNARNDLIMELTHAPYSVRQEILAKYISSQVKRVFGMGPDTPIDTRRPLSELGMDSLMAVELRNILSKTVGKNIPATIVFEYPTIWSLSEYILNELALEPSEEEKPIQPHNVEDQVISGRLAELEQISDEEAEALLLEKLMSKNKK